MIGTTMVAWLALLLAALPALLFFRNLRLYLPPEDEPSRVSEDALDPNRKGAQPLVSILIPARNESRGIAASVEAALASKGIALEVVVLDDHSDDDTAAIVKAIAERDSRVRLLHAPPLPPGWCGKQRACWLLADLAQGDVFVFLDADVRVAPRGIAQAVHFLQQSGAALVSGVPHQQTGTLAEKLVVPLIHFVLLGFLPIDRMRQSQESSYGVGCGQLFVTSRDSYRQAGGHAAIQESLHDGIRLPRAYRNRGLMTDLFDATDVASCRMYRGAAEVWRGLQKNAVEGLAAPRLIVPVTVLLILGQVVPFVLLALAPWLALSPLGWLATSLAVVAAWYPRLHGAVRFRQSVVGAILHPVGIILLLAIQWSAWGRWLFRRPVRWKDRRYATPPPRYSDKTHEDRSATTFLEAADRAVGRSAGWDTRLPAGNLANHDLHTGRELSRRTPEA